MGENHDDLKIVGEFISDGNISGFRDYVFKRLNRIYAFGIAYILLEDLYEVILQITRLHGVNMPEDIQLPLYTVLPPDSLKIDDVLNKLYSVKDYNTSHLPEILEKYRIEYAKHAELEVELFRCRNLLDFYSATCHYLGVESESLKLPELLRTRKTKAVQVGSPRYRLKEVQSLDWDNFERGDSIISLREDIYQLLEIYGAMSTYAIANLLRMKTGRPVALATQQCSWFARNENGELIAMPRDEKVSPLINVQDLRDYSKAKGKGRPGGASPRTTGGKRGRPKKQYVKQLTEVPAVVSPPSTVQAIAETLNNQEI